ncbi:uncharacterized protein LOC133182415 [Saccostrea echinata]|uniref:uncharacterized protein LOC133182415 n=1 Tax=Saccostrea echinata TaxID=191078 RepID=UPI002A834BA6|nr:uncharacterized protein LOC133182415 [Saccostrea echinata]
MEEFSKDGPSAAKKTKVTTEDSEVNNENSHGSGGFAPSGEEETSNELFNQDTEPYDIESCESNENLFGGGVSSPTVKDSDSPLREEAGTPVVEIEEKQKSFPSKMKTIESVLQDAKLITNIVEGIDVDAVYEKLKTRRGKPNRVDLVINEILENIEKVKKEGSKGNSKENTAIVEDLVKVIDKATANISRLPITAGEIQQLLTQHQDRPDRVDYVVSQVLVKHYKPLPNQKQEYVDDMMKVLSDLPNADPEHVYKLVEKHGQETDRVQKVIDYLQKQKDPQHSLQKEASLPTDPKYLEDPLYRDMRIVCKVLPDKEANEVYEYLTAHHDKKDRLKVVIEELMKSGHCDSQSFPPSVDQHSAAFSDVMGVGSNGTLPKNIQEEVDELMEIFPDCDPNYLYDELEEHSDDKERLKNIAMKMFEHKKYPRLKDTLEERKRRAEHNKIQHLQFEMESFLVRFPDPLGTFLNVEQDMSSSYREHALQQLRRDFRQLKKSFILKALEKYNYHYHLTKKEIEKELENTPVRSKKFRREPLQEEDCRMPEQPEEFFYYEKLFSENEEEIKRYLHDKEQVYELRLQEARDNGELMECQCCFDEECLFEDMAACPDGHLFCKTCIRRSAEVVIGQGKTDFKCLTGTCSDNFSLATLQHILPTSVFSIVLRKMQEEEIKKAEIPDLVSCPFCSFATIMPDQNDKVFKCLNPECLKESCRLCNEPNHIPLRCNEVEKQGEMNMRTYIEARLTEAMIRRCHVCQKAFVKEFGCNKMTCTCGATSCYVCRAKDIDYDHFTKEECNQGDMNKLHREEMLKAATEARDKYIQDHPEAADIDLKYDPLKHIEEFEGLKEGEYDGDEDEEYDEED